MRNNRVARWHVTKRRDDLRMLWLVDDFDSGPGVCLTVTNDAENVVAEVNKRFPGYRVIYRDTDGHWDELAHVNGRFTGFIAGQASAPDLY